MFILVIRLRASGFRVPFLDELDAAVFGTASAELLWCVNKLKKVDGTNDERPPLVLEQDIRGMFRHRADVHDRELVPLLIFW